MKGFVCAESEPTAQLLHRLSCWDTQFPWADSGGEADTTDYILFARTLLRNAG